MLRIVGIALLTLLFLAAMSEGVFTRDLTIAFTAALAAAALITALLAYRRMRKTTREAQDMFAELERAARRANAAVLMAASPAPTPHATKSLAKPRAKQHRALPIPANEPGSVTRSARFAGSKAMPSVITDDVSSAEDALLLAIGKHELDISLEPIVELQSSVVIAYRVHAFLESGDGSRVHVRRLEGKHTGIDPARFDAELFHAAASAMRRLLGASADVTPLICPVGISVLSSHKDLRKFVGMMAALPGLQSGLVLEVPGDALQHEGLASTGAALLLDAGIRLAVEGPLPEDQHTEILERFAFEFWSMKGAHIALSGKLADTGETGTRLIATHLAEDHDVIAMIDAGVKLVCGPLFADPKPVRRRGDLGPDLPDQRKEAL